MKYVLWLLGAAGTFIGILSILAGQTVVSIWTGLALFLVAGPLFAAGSYLHTKERSR